MKLLPTPLRLALLLLPVDPLPLSRIGSIIELVSRKLWRLFILDLLR